MNGEVVYSAAHAEFPDTEPLGGGKAVADYLCRAHPQWTVLSPRSIGLALPKPLSAMSELQYARFCREFERKTTAEILKRDPRRCVVLSNDISEGPDFATLGTRGYRIVTIFHVDVVEFFTTFYLRGMVRPETAAGFRWFGLLPDVLRLVFEKQFECVRHSARIVVPSEPMKETILRCYPWCPRENIVVLPWGNITAAHAAATEPVAEVHPVKRGEASDFVIMTLSRLSPEKGIERLLAALPLVTGNVRVWICGAPAYMKGKRYEQKLRRMADGRVEFLGHVTGAHKAALLQRADLFVSPSRHESYGLTIAEAQAAGCPVISHQHYGASGLVVDCANPKELARAISDVVEQGRRTKKPLSHGKRSDAAEQLARLLTIIAPAAVAPSRT